MWFRTIILYPFIIIFLLFSYFSMLIFAIIRTFISFLLVSKYGPAFKGFFSGSDRVWILDEDVSRGICNTMFYISVAKNEISSILPELRKRIHDVMMNPIVHPKMFYKRHQEFGYSFWLGDDPGTIEKYVRPWIFTAPGEHISKDYLRHELIRANTADLPDQNTRNWELLIGSKGMMEDEDSVKIPILFRAFHGVGDGIALTRLKTELWADEPEVPRKESRKSFMDKVKDLLDIFVVAAVTPHKNALDLFLRPVDENFIHPEKLTGQKVIQWIHESDAEVPLLDTVKKIRRKFPGVRFNDVMAGIYSRSFRRFFAAKSQTVPDHLTIYMADRIESPYSTALEITNEFAVAQYNLPVEREVKDFGGLLQDIKQNIPPLQNDLDIKARHLTISLMFSYSPQWLLTMLKRNIHSTVAMSNFPGPSRSLKICGREWRDMTTWLPNTGRAAVTVLSTTYDGKLQIAVLADKAAIKSEDDLKLILDGMVEEIKGLRKTFNIE